MDSGDPELDPSGEQDEAKVPDEEIRIFYIEDVFMIIMDASKGAVTFKTA